MRYVEVSTAYMWWWDEQHEHWYLRPVQDVELPDLTSPEKSGRLVTTRCESGGESVWC